MIFELDMYIIGVAENSSFLLSHPGNYIPLFPLIICPFCFWDSFSMISKFCCQIPHLVLEHLYHHLALLRAFRFSGGLPEAQAVRSGCAFSTEPARRVCASLL